VVVAAKMLLTDSSMIPPLSDVVLACALRYFGVWLLLLFDDVAIFSFLWKQAPITIRFATGNWFDYTLTVKGWDCCQPL